MMREEQFHFAPHRGIISATSLNTLAPLFIFEFRAFEEDVFDKAMLLVVHGSSPASSLRSQARIIVHSASIVRFDTLST